MSFAAGLMGWRGKKVWCWGWDWIRDQIREAGDKHGVVLGVGTGRVQVSRKARKRISISLRN
jgi:hypothetical protein